MLLTTRERGSAPSRADPHGGGLALAGRAAPLGRLAAVVGTREPSLAVLARRGLGVREASQAWHRGRARASRRTRGRSGGTSVARSRRGGGALRELTLDLPHDAVLATIAACSSRKPGRGRPRRRTHDPTAAPSSHAGPSRRFIGRSEPSFSRWRQLASYTGLPSPVVATSSHEDGTSSTGLDSRT
jgi:hypothetical protein